MPARTPLLARLMARTLELAIGKVGIARLASRRAEGTPGPASARLAVPPPGTRTAVARSGAPPMPAPPPQPASIRAAGANGAAPPTALSLDRLFASPQSLATAFVAAEILGKPAALRDR